MFILSGFDVYNKVILRCLAGFGAKNYQEAVR